MLKSALKKWLTPSAKKNLDIVRYEIHLFAVRLSNAAWPPNRTKRHLLEQRSGIMLHWGCGSRRLDGWVNIDGWKSRATDYVHDLRTRLPLRDQSVELIFTEHVLEHIELEFATSVLNDFFRILQPGGRVRIIVPGLAECCNAFLQGDADWFRRVDAPCDTAGIGFNRIFYSHFHRHIYDFDTLEHLLRKAGFSRIVRSSHLQSIDPRLNLDTDCESRALVSLYVDAIK
jgi:predicted SAM-dependent methyltransferase